MYGVISLIIGQEKAVAGDKGDLRPVGRNEKDFVTGCLRRGLSVANGGAPHSTLCAPTLRQMAALVTFAKNIG